MKLNNSELGYKTKSLTSFSLSMRPIVNNNEKTTIDTNMYRYVNTYLYI